MKNAISEIRARLRLTQSALADGIEVTQGNISFYEKGQTVPPAVAEKLIEFAKGHGLLLTFDMVYGAAPLPPESPTTSEASPEVGEHAQAAPFLDTQREVDKITRSACARRDGPSSEREGRG